jgi:hypothetical protein
MAANHSVEFRCDLEQAFSIKGAIGGQHVEVWVETVREIPKSLCGRDGTWAGIRLRHRPGTGS